MHCGKRADLQHRPVVPECIRRFIKTELFIIEVIYSVPLKGANKIGLPFQKLIFQLSEIEVMGACGCQWLVARTTRILGKFTDKNSVILQS